MSDVNQWMLRQDGKLFKMDTFLDRISYSDFKYEVDMASFILVTKSRDTRLAYQVIDTWLAFCIENLVSIDDDSATINDIIAYAASSNQFDLKCPLTTSEIINAHESACNYDDTDSLYNFCDAQRDNLNILKRDIEYSMNQQFSKLILSDGSMKCSVSSQNYNWIHSIRCALAIIKDEVSDISIVRDGNPHHYYRLSDGSICKRVDPAKLIQSNINNTCIRTLTSFKQSSDIEGLILSYLAKGYLISEVNKMLSDDKVSYDVYSALNDDADKLIEIQ